MLRVAAHAVVVMAVLAPPVVAPALAADSALIPDWGGVAGPTRGPSQVVGGYSRGCLDGAWMLPLDGPGYQVMRPSRDRFYGHPDLIRFVRWLGESSVAAGSAGILVGDLAQARGGPMRSGHASHQTGLDVDIWFLPAPAYRLSRDERESLSATSVVAADGRTLHGQRWSDSHATLLRAAALRPEVARIFVNAAIKHQLCQTAGDDRRWLAKIRPWWGHVDHFHVRLACPSDSALCVEQAPPPPGDGCDETLAWWMSGEARAELARRRASAKPSGPPKLTDLPERCRTLYFRPALAPTSLPGEEN